MTFVEHAREEIEQCDSIEDKEKRIACKVSLMRDITEAQDIVNLNIRGEIDDSRDSRWLPIHLVDDANAVILGVTQERYHPGHLKDGYVGRKVDNFTRKWWQI